MNMLALGVELVERGWVPDRLTRWAIRRLCGERLRTPRRVLDAPPDARAQQSGASAAEQPSAFPSTAELETRAEAPRRAAPAPSRPRVRDAEQAAFLAEMRRAPIALATDKANEQHYELPAEFFAALLGPRRKYSCCYWADDAATLAEAEEAALAATCQRAELEDGQRVLELGCGWGSLSLWMAERYPRSEVTAVSNSASQRVAIEALARERGLTNLRVVTADMNTFAPPPEAFADGGFDRVVSVEMFEHMRNHALLFERIAAWLRPQGKFFMHVFCHKHLLYPFETDGAANWMGRYFFTGGIMPNLDLPRHFDDALRVRDQWTWNGRHYQRTAEAWLDNLDRRRDELLPILARAYGQANAARWLRRWRMFLFAVAELFGYRRGEEWMVAHYLLERAGR